MPLQRVTLTENFDAPADVKSAAGDIVDVVPAPAGVEIDASSIWVRLVLKSGELRDERVYEHEFQPVE